MARSVYKTEDEKAINTIDRIVANRVEVCKTDNGSVVSI